MSIETAGFGAFIIVLVMTLVTLSTRWGGVFVMSFVPIGDRVKRFIHAMSGSVFVALLVPMAAAGDMGARLALVTTAVVMLLSRQPLLAISAGVAAAALVRQI